ncbi:MAG: hypothetical protein U0T73_00765 [Chitinophagales bacterium]
MNFTGTPINICSSEVQNRLYNSSYYNSVYYSGVSNVVFGGQSLREYSYTGSASVDFYFYNSPGSTPQVYDVVDYSSLCSATKIKMVIDGGYCTSGKLVTLNIAGTNYFRFCDVQVGGNSYHGEFSR